MEDGKIILMGGANRTKSNRPHGMASGPVLPLSQDGPGMQRVAQILTALFQTMNIFGRPPASLKVIIPFFLADLWEYPIQAIELAFASWRRDNSAFPTPHDILNILRFDLNESVPDPIGYPGWFVRRADLKPGDDGYISPPALAGEIHAVIESFREQAPGKVIGEIATGVIERIGRDNGGDNE